MLKNTFVALPQGHKKRDLCRTGSPCNPQLRGCGDDMEYMQFK